MAARTPRRSFATPFVVTLAAAPAACYVQSSTGPTAPPPSQPPAQTAQTEPAQPTQPPQHPPIITNPPMPQQNPPPTTTPTPPPTTTPASSQLMTWTVFKGNDGCMAAIKSECPPKATCNPPPPFKYACPENTSLDQPVTVVSRDGGATCSMEFPMPKCPPNAVCNPPRPRPVSCPKR